MALGTTISVLETLRTKNSFMIKLFCEPMNLKIENVEKSLSSFFHGPMSELVPWDMAKKITENEKLLQLSMHQMHGAKTENVVISEQIADYIWETWHASKIAYDPVATEREVTPEQYWILRLLYNSGSMRVKDIATHIGTTSSPVTISVKRLERENLVKRQRSKVDERVVTVRLTRRGKERFESWRQRRRKVLSGFFDALSEKEKTTLACLLSKLVLAISEKSAGAQE
jgi:MarR family transcriptional regulator, organic hydroperoxide resistance regulator